jgi:hypothetical protein
VLGVSDRSAADGTAVKDGGMAEQAHVEEAAQAEFRTPEPAMNGPARERQRLGRPSTPHLDDGNPIAFFRQTKRGNTPPKAGSNHDEIELLVIGLMPARFHTSRSSRFALIDTKTGATYATMYLPVSMTLCAIVRRRASVLNGSYLHSRRRIANCERSMSPSAHAAITSLAALSIFSMAPVI